MIRVLCLCFILFGCTTANNFIEQAPKQDYCNIFLKEELSSNPFYLNCYNEPEDIFYNVEGVDAQNYVAVSITSIIDLISWVRKAESILANSRTENERKKAEVDLEQARMHLNFYRTSLENRLKQIQKVR